MVPSLVTGPVLSEILSPAASTAKSHSFTLESETSKIPLSDSLAHPPQWRLPEMHSAVSTNASFSTPTLDQTLLRPPVSNQIVNAVAATTAQPATIASSDDTGGVLTRAQKAKSLLHELDLNTAIQLRWTMRDIRGKRTKFSPVSHSDLKALVNLGFIEMRDGIPRLTDLGDLALD
jgi:hypothetical protein